MQQEPTIEEKVGVIRSLFERAPTYRVISARSALVAGFLSILAASAIYLNNQTNITGGLPIRSRQFAIIWIAVFVLSLTASTFFLWREARKTGRPLISAGMNLALRAITPCLVIPGVYTAWFLTTGYLGGDRLTLVVVWVAFYGLALLSTEFFAPRSIPLLGWTFLITSLAIPVVLDATTLGFSPAAPNYIMGVSFGLYHLVYAAATWSRRRAITTQ